MSDIELPMWLVVPVGLLLTVGVLALPLIVAFLPGDEEQQPPLPDQPNPGT